MKKIFIILVVFLFCSGFMGQSWYEKYGIKRSELSFIEVLPKMLAPLKNEDPHVVEQAALVIMKFNKKAKNYFKALVDAAQSEACMRNPGPFKTVMRCALAVYDESLGDADIERLFLSGLAHSHYGVRDQTCRSISEMNIYTPKIIETLDALSKNDTNENTRQLALNTMIIIKSNRVVSNTQPMHKSISQNSSGFNVEEHPYAIAVVIGNMDYVSSKKSVPNVDYAINDAMAIKEMLVNARGYRDGNIIYLENATQADITSTFGNKDNHKGKLFNWVRPESDVFVYYSGHGAPSLKDGSGYLLPVDADPSTVELNGYPLDVLYQNISKLQAKSITVVIDACFSGSSQGGTITKSASSITLKPITMPKVQGDMNVLSATNVGEVASWDTEAKHSLFTSYFLKALSGAADKKPYGNEDYRVDLAEVQKFVNLEVTYVARRNFGRDQNPQVSGNSNFVFSVLK